MAPKRRAASVSTPTRPMKRSSPSAPGGKVIIESGGKSIEVAFDIGADLGQIKRSVEMALGLNQRLEGSAQRLESTVEEVIGFLDTLGRSTPAGAATPGSGLTQAEEDVLREAGSLQVPLPTLAQRPSTDSAHKLQRMLADALSVKDAAAALHLTPGRIRQLIAARSLLAVQSNGLWKLPRFQFAEADPLSTVRGLDKVLQALPADAHPLVVQAFLDQPHVDLDIDGEPHTPKDWLEGGGNAEAVVDLARDLYRLP